MLRKSFMLRAGVAASAPLLQPKKKKVNVDFGSCVSEADCKKLALEYDRRHFTAACALTKSSDVSDWSSHVSSTGFRLRHALLRRYRDSPEPVQDLWCRVSMPQKMVEEFDARTDSRRMERLSKAMRFLVQHNVLLHSILRWHASNKTWNVTKEFGRIALVGETLLAAEVGRRLAVLLPDAPADLLNTLRKEAVSLPFLAKLFHELHLNYALPPEARRKSKLSERQRAAMMFAMIGELHWFVVKTKATDRTHNNALFPPSDVLILHVLAAHALEALVATTVFQQVAQPMGDVRAVWGNFGTSLPVQAARRTAVSSHLSLNIVPVNRDSNKICGEETPPTTEDQSTEASAEDPKEKKVGARKLRKLKKADKGEPTTFSLEKPSATPVLGSFASVSTPTVHWKRFHSAIAKYEDMEESKKVRGPTLATTKA